MNEYKDGDTIYFKSDLGHNVYKGTVVGTSRPLKDEKGRPLYIVESEYKGETFTTIVNYFRMVTDEEYKDFEVLNKIEEKIRALEAQKRILNNKKYLQDKK